MSARPRPMFTGISEIVLVVRDLDEAMKRQWEMFGIGPWDIWTFDESTVADMVVHDRPCSFSARVAYTAIGSTHWELIQPLDTHSTYYEHLLRHGEGVHNIVFSVDDFDETAAAMRALGIGTRNSGNWKGTRFLNFDSASALGAVAEIFDTADGAGFPAPERTYPPTA